MSATSDRMERAADLMVKRGLTVKESSGWQSRGRPYSFNPTKGLICHHTGGTEDIDNVLINGRSDLPGPLCQYALHKNDDVVLIAGGYANHAGESLPGAPTNSTGWGIEATGPIPTGAYGPNAFPQYDAYAVMVGAMLDADSWGLDKIWFHKTSCSPKGRKIDPSFDTQPFINKVGSGGAIEEDDLTDEQARQLKGIYDAMVVPGSTDPSEPYEKNYDRVKAILSALQVPGTTTPEQSVEILYRRVQANEKYIGQLCEAAGIDWNPVDTSAITG